MTSTETSSIDVLLMRHGAPDLPDGIYPDPFVVALSERGRGEAAGAVAAIDRFAPDLVIASDFARALETAKIAAGPHRSIEIVSELRERVMFSLVGRSFTGIHDEFGDMADGALHGNSDQWDLSGEETYSEAHRRVVAYFVALSRRVPGQRVLAVAHGGPHAWMLEAALGVDLRGVRTFGLDTGHFSRFQVDDGVFRLDAVNLPPAGVEPNPGVS